MDGMLIAHKNKGGLDAFRLQLNNNLGSSWILLGMLVILGRGSSLPVL